MPVQYIANKKKENLFYNNAMCIEFCKIEKKMHQSAARDNRKMNLDPVISYAVQKSVIVPYVFP